VSHLNPNHRVEAGKGELREEEEGSSILKKRKEAELIKSPSVGLAGKGRRNGS